LLAGAIYDVGDFVGNHEFKVLNLFLQQAYLSSKFISYEKPVFNLDRSDHVLGHHHHLLLLWLHELLLILKDFLLRSSLSLAELLLHLLLLVFHLFKDQQGTHLPFRPI